MHIAAIWHDHNLGSSNPEKRGLDTPQEERRAEWTASEIKRQNSVAKNCMEVCDREKPIQPPSISPTKMMVEFGSNIVDGVYKGFSAEACLSQRHTMIDIVDDRLWPDADIDWLSAKL